MIQIIYIDVNILNLLKKFRFYLIFSESFKFRLLNLNGPPLFESFFRNQQSALKACENILFF